MKLWKENKINQEYEMDNKEIARKFLSSKYAEKKEYRLEHHLALFISMPDGLNSMWDWDKKKGSIAGNKDMLEILDIINTELGD